LVGEHEMRSDCGSREG